MASNTAIKLYKNSYTPAQGGVSGAKALSENNAGGIYFDQTYGEIWVGGHAYGGGSIRNVDFANGILTITKSDGSTQTLDFNDVASAQATLVVFEHMNQLMGATQDSVGTRTVLDYSNTNYLGTDAVTSLVSADKELDRQIKSINDTIGSMDAENVHSVVLDNTDGVIQLTFKGVSETDGVISQGTDAYVAKFAKVATTGQAVDVTVVDTAGVFIGTNVEDVLLELSSKISDSNLSIDGYVGQFTTDSNSFVTISTNSKVLEVNLNSDGYIKKDANGLDLQHVDTTGNSVIGTDLATVNTVKTYIGTEIAALDVTEYAQAEIGSGTIKIKGIGESNGKIVSETETTINVDGGTVSSENPLLTKQSLTDAIGTLDVEEYAQAEVGTDAFSVYGIKEVDGKIEKGANKVTLAIADGYDASDNKVATEDTVKNAVDALDVTTDVHGVEYTAATSSTGAKLTFKGMQEENGKIKLGSGTSELNLTLVATTGAAADVTLAAADTPYVGSNVDETIVNVDSRLKALETLPTFDTVVSTDAANTPNGITWNNAGTTVTGELVASSDTMHIIYLVPATRSGQSVNTYAEYITIKNGNSYSWEKVGDTSTDLNGYVKTITLNGKEYAVTSNTTNVALGNAITSITDNDDQITSDSSYTSDYVDSEVTATTTLSTETGANETVIISTAKVKVQAVETSGDNAKGLAEASDVKAYVGTQISNLTFSTATTGTNVQVAYSETNGVVNIAVTENYATVDSNLGVTNPNQLVVGSDIEKVKTYVDTQLSSQIEALDVHDTVTGTNVSFEYDETDGVIEIGTLVVDYTTVNRTAKVGTETAPALSVTDGTKIAVGSDIEKVKLYADDKIEYEIEQLNADVTSSAQAVATVEVVEAEGVITNVNVTTRPAGVVYTAATAGATPTNANLTATDTTGAVIGTDIAAIKSYIDAKATEASTVSNADATIPVGTDVASTVLGTIAGTPITAKVSFTWEEYQ